MALQPYQWRHQNTWAQALQPYKHGHQSADGPRPPKSQTIPVWCGALHDFWQVTPTWPVVQTSRAKEHSMAHNGLRSIEQETSVERFFQETSHNYGRSHNVGLRCVPKPKQGDHFRTCIWQTTLPYLTHNGFQILELVIILERYSTDIKPKIFKKNSNSFFRN